jgi:nicotinate phosphoribosyltransferase
VRAAEAIGESLGAVRLDTPGSRRGDFPQIIREVRWELDIRGHKDVGIFVSGGLDEEAVRLLGEAGADGFGVGTYVSCAPAVDFALDIVEVEGRPAAKRGKLSGRKQVWRCPRCMADTVQLSGQAPPRCPSCGGETEAMLQPIVKHGEIIGDLKPPKEIRECVLEQIKKLEKP